MRRSMGRAWPRTVTVQGALLADEDAVIGAAMPGALVKTSLAGIGGLCALAGCDTSARAAVPADLRCVIARDDTIEWPGTL